MPVRASAGLDNNQAMPGIILPDRNARLKNRLNNKGIGPLPPLPSAYSSKYQNIQKFYFFIVAIFFVTFVIILYRSSAWSRCR